jgi:hypothetical protein
MEKGKRRRRRERAEKRRKEKQPLVQTATTFLLSNRLLVNPEEQDGSLPRLEDPIRLVLQSSDVFVG